MNRLLGSILRWGVLWLCATLVYAQAKSGPPLLQAGSAEDKALRVIENESDPAKRITLLDQFLKDYPALVDLVDVNLMYAYAYQQTKNIPKMMEHGDKVLAVQPNEVTILPLLINSLLDQSAQIDKAVDYARRYQAVAKSLDDPEATVRVSEADRTRIKAEARTLFEGARQQKEFAVMQAAYSETNFDKKIQALDELAKEFPDSPQLPTVYSMIAVTYLQKQNVPKAAEYAEKSLKVDPNNLDMLVVLGDIYSEDKTKATQAAEYVKKAVELADALEGQPMPEGQTEANWKKRKNYLRGSAHSLRGYQIMKAAQYAKALPDLELACKLLGDDSAALYRMGFALAKLRRSREAAAYLNRAAKLPGPYQQAAKNALAQMGKE